MTFYVPVGFIAIYISLYLFRENNRRNQLKRAERRDQIDSRTEELIARLAKSQHAGKTTNDSSSKMD